MQQMFSFLHSGSNIYIYVHFPQALRIAKLSYTAVEINVFSSISHALTLYSFGLSLQKKVLRPLQKSSGVSA